MAKIHSNPLGYALSVLKHYQNDYDSSKTEKGEKYQKIIKIIKEYKIKHQKPRLYLPSTYLSSSKFASYDLLVIDEWLIFSLSIDDIRFLYELFELRYKKSSTIFVGQYRTTEWHTRLGGLHADSILNCIVHNIIVIESGSIKMRELLDSKSINIKFKDAFS